ncbi:MAG: S-layer protein, partial [Candidatus Nanohaloarchaea archaeon]|nr:S-layer protein [Candidatus Nanohaloarchaea archaeon]
MKVQDAIRKASAAIGSTLLIGSTLGAAASLADFPGMFVDDNGDVTAEIVVGTQAKTADVVAAVDVAAALGQRTVQTSQVQTSTTQENVDGKQYSQVGIRTGTVPQGWIDKSDYSQLARTQVEDDDGESHRVLEQIGVQGTVGNTVNRTQVRATVAQDAVRYQVSYTPGFADSERIQVLDQNYTITGFNEQDGTDTVELGSTLTKNGMELGDSYTHGPYTVEVVDKDEDAGAIYVAVSKDGQVLKQAGLDANTGDQDSYPASLSVDSGSFVLDATTVFFGSKRDYIDVQSTYTDTTLIEGEDAPMDQDYTVSGITANVTDFDRAAALQSLTLSSDLFTAQDPDSTDTADDIPRLRPGDSFHGPENYFSLIYQGLTHETMGNVTVKDGYTVSYTDVTGFQQTV